MEPYEVPCEIASGEGERSSAVSQDELLALDRSHCSSSLCYLTGSFFMLLSNCVQFLHFSRKATMDPCEVLPKTREKGETSSSAISKNDYEVFLSFRGPDTRRGFADCLYHAMVDAGICVFMDDDELALGDKIDEILTALNNSKICMVVLSPRFAESAWCLREVERMVDMEKDIVPIFYDVTPDDVKLKTELYAKALTMHEYKYGKKRVQLWREALKQIPTIKGRELKNTRFVEFSRKIAKEILTKFKVKHRYEIENFVEVDDEVEAALKLLDIGSGGCRFLAIHGMGGIGKTTLAKVIFNQIFGSFDCSCFLKDIRESLSQLGGLQKLQEQLLRSLDPSLQDATHIFDAMGKIKNNFKRKKVLIVLDDIYHRNHIHDLVGSFGSGSRIIFTTRNSELYEQGTSSDVHFYSLEKKPMDNKQALKLFSRNAFSEDSPSKDFENLSTEAISTTGGLPLALEVAGSLLRHRNAKFWKDMIEKLKKAPHHDVQGKLKISYEALDAEQQEIFLDIACFFIGEEITNAIYMWEACEFYPNNGIEVLISMSLIKLDEKKCFWMHDQLRDLGRALVKENSKDARAGSRLWMHKNALDLLNKNVGKEKIEGLQLDGPSGYLDRENFLGLEKLRYLRLAKCVKFGGDFSGLIPKLRWLSLSLLYASSFSATNLCLRELVVLELSCSFDETWQGWGQILISQKLKVLTLSDCDKLISTPDLSKIVNLERLVLERCDMLTFIHNSVGKLLRLQHLSITSCEFVHELPESIGCLVSLRRLELDEGVAKLPNSIGELVKLKHLSLRGSVYLSVLPDSIGDLSLLISLNLRESGITKLPSSIGRLAKLKYLCLAWCRKLKKLPDSIGNLHSLIDLDMSDSSISKLPHSFGNLASLQKLRLWGSRIKSLPDSFRGLEKLEWLDFGGSYSDEGYWIRELHGLPNGLTWLHFQGVEKIQNLSNLINLSYLKIDNPVSTRQPFVVLEGVEKLIKLKFLSIESWDVRSLSIEWGALQQLKSLRLHCPELEFRQCQLPSSLELLDLNVKKWGQLPINLSSLKNLSKLKLSNFVMEEADSIEGLESLEDLEMNSCILKLNDFSMLTRLRKLNLKKCRSDVEGASPPVDDDLEGVSVIGSKFQIKLSNLNNLSKLKLIAEHDRGLECSKLQIELSNLKNLSKLELNYFSIHDDGFEGCESLVNLVMYGCTIFEFANNVSALKRLRSLLIKYCSFPTMTPCLHIPPQLDSLVELTILSCRAIVDVQGIGKLKYLRKLWISDCNSLRTIGDLSELKGLVSIEITHCYSFEGIDGVDRLLSTGTLSHLSIKYCKCESVQYANVPCKWCKQLTSHVGGVTADGSCTYQGELQTAAEQI